MNKLLKRISYILGIGALLLAPVACDDDAEELTSVEYDRLFTPTGLEFRVNQVDVTASWGCLSAADSISYVAEIFINDTGMAFEGEPTATYTTATRSCLMEGLEGATTYSFRVKAVGQTKESYWAESTFQTATEQIMEAVATADIGGTYVTVRWPAGESNIGSIVLTPTSDTSAATVEYTVTDEDKANGYAYIEGISPETDYTAVLYSESGSIRGQRTFTTTIDTGNMTVLRGGTSEDLIAAIEADNGEGIFLMEAATYDLGSYTLTKDLTIAGNPATPSTIAVSFKVESGVGSLSLLNLTLDGSAGESTQSNLIEFTAGTASLNTITLSSCDITGYGSNFIYTNNGGAYGDIIITNCYVHDTCPSGGDGFDFRGSSSLNSLTVTNSTFANGFRTFLRCQATLTGDISFTNCTFYNVCTNNDSNNNGLFRITDGESSVFTVENCIFYGIGFEAASGNMAVWTRTDGMNVSREVYNNNYWYNSPNLWGQGHADDHDSVATEADPGFVDAENGDLTITNEDMIFYQVGDPRWIAQ